MTGQRRLDDQAALVARELTNIIDNDRFFLSPRIQMLREIRNMADASTAATDQELRAAARRSQSPSRVVHHFATGSRSLRS